MAGLHRSRPILLLLLVVPAVAVPARLAETPREAGTWWLEPAAEVRHDPITDRLQPTRPGAPVTFTYAFAPTAAPAALSLTYDSHLGGPGDLIRVEAGTDASTLLALADQTWQAGRQRLELGALLSASKPLLVRFTLHAASRVERVWVANLTWFAENVSRVAPPGARLPRAAWLYPAWAAHTANRLATGLPPGAPVSRGRGRLSGPAPATWASADGLLQASWWPILGQPERVRQLVLPLGRSGGQLQAEGVLLADHALPHMPVAMTLPVRGPWPATSVVGLAPGRQAELLETGRLELRHARPRWDGTTLWIEFTVVNHAGQELVGGLQGQLDGDAWAAAGYRFPPGGWLARLAFTPRRPRLWQPGRPEVYVVRVELADGATLSDATSLAIGLKEVTCERGRWRLHDQTLELINAENAADVSRAADRTATAVVVSPRNAPELLAEAERRGVPVVIESTAPAELLAAELLYGGRAAVLGTRLR